MRSVDEETKEPRQLLFKLAPPQELHNQMKLYPCNTNLVLKLINNIALQQNCLNILLPSQQDIISSICFLVKGYGSPADEKLPTWVGNDCPTMTALSSLSEPGYSQPQACRTSRSFQRRNCIRNALDFTEIAFFRNGQQQNLGSPAQTL